MKKHFFYGPAGIGDIIHKLHTHDDYAEIESDSEIWIYSNNPNAAQLFASHPARPEIHYFPAVLHSVCPIREHAHVSQIRNCYTPVEFGIPASEKAMVDQIILSFRYPVIFAPNSHGIDRTFPSSLIQDLVYTSRATSIRLFQIGSNYRNHSEPHISGTEYLVDLLSFPGLYYFISKAAGIITALSSATAMAWFLWRPMYLPMPKSIYDSQVKNQLALNPEEYGHDQDHTTHVLFEDYTQASFLSWIEKLKPVT